MGKATRARSADSVPHGHSVRRGLWTRREMPQSLVAAMPGLIINLAGQTFGRLKVPANAVPVIRNRHAYWPCDCDCGARIEARGTKLRAQRIVSCGCWKADGMHNHIRAARTPDRTREMRRLRASGMTFAAIGEIYGVSRQCAEQTITPTRKRAHRETTNKCQRCPCRRYVLSYAVTIGHQCEPRTLR